jgi:hypothetical protein
LLNLEYLLLKNCSIFRRSRDWCLNGLSSVAFLFVGGEFLANAGKVSLKLAKGVFLQ